MAMGDVFEVIDVQTNNGQETLNVYFYKSNNLLGADADANDLADAFLGQMMPLIRGAQTSVINHTGLKVRNLFNDADRTDRAISLTGTRSNLNAEPTFAAVGYKLGQNNGSVKNGAKRIAGLDDNDISNGLVIGSVVTALTALATGMEGTLLYGVIAQFLPVVVKRILEGGDYRLPANAGESITGAIIEVVWDALVTTQVSRKVGTGS